MCPGFQAEGRALDLRAPLSRLGCHHAGKVGSACRRMSAAPAQTWPGRERQGARRPDKLATVEEAPVAKGPSMLRPWMCGLVTAAIFAAAAPAQDKPKKPVSDIKIDGKTLSQWEREITDRD